MTKLYHKDICLPYEYKTYTDAIINKPYILSKHLLERLNKADRSHSVTIKGLNYAIYKIRSNKSNPFEIETKDGEIVKCVVRIKYNKFQDISIVFLDKGEYTKIKSCWLNKNDDSHKTLDMTKYEREI